MKQKLSEGGLSRENPIIKHSISLRKFDRVFPNPIIKHLNSSKTLK